jgi:hypothetical protein
MAKRIKPKRVVYLWGAGATHAEGQRLGSTSSLLMRGHTDFGEGITTRILRRVGKRAISSFGSGEDVDIEKLISLLVASGVEEHVDLAEKMRSNYFVELRASLAKAKLLTDPQLAIDLFMMHRDSTFSNEVEVLAGVITTNHDGLLQLASERVFGGINPGFEFDSKNFSQARMDTPLILQLHGSFTWHFSMPIRIEKLNQQSKYAGTVWIPPTILKESKSYPFNKLTGRAYELLARECDVLRVIGTSLTQNDWNILSLIFNAQRHREAAGGQAFLVELIMPRAAGEVIEKDCAYLKNLITIGFLTEGRFSPYNDDSIAPLRPEDDMANPFAYWLNEKFEFHRRRGELAYLRQTSQLSAVEATA